MDEWGNETREKGEIEEIKKSGKGGGGGENEECRERNRCEGEDGRERGEDTGMGQMEGRRQWKPGAEGKGVTEGDTRGRSKGREGRGRGGRKDAGEEGDGGTARREQGGGRAARTRVPDEQQLEEVVVPPPRHAQTPGPAGLGGGTRTPRSPCGWAGQGCWRADSGAWSRGGSPTARAEEGGPDPGRVAGVPQPNRDQLTRPFPRGQLGRGRGLADRPRPARPRGPAPGQTRPRGGAGREGAGLFL